MDDLDKLYKCFLKSNGVSIDTRTMMPGQLFFALSGENFNGNKFALDALEKKASYVVVDESVENEDERIIKVDNALISLQKLANKHRKELGTTIIAITGSNGKTTTKELLYHVLATQYNCQYTKGNLNNHIGVPLTLLTLESKHELAIIEMGANHLGEIKTLCELAEPDFGLVTNMGKAHLEGFGSLEGVIKGKSELYDFLKKNDGVIFYNGEDKILINQIDSYYEAYKYFPSAIDTGNNDKTYLSFNWGASEILTNLTGHYNLFNIAAAIFLGQYFKIKTSNIISAISEYVPRNNRSEIRVVNGVEYFLDAYNANPTSMKLSLENFFNIEQDEKYLILGDMLELGEVSKFEHGQILEYVYSNQSLTGVILVGDEFMKLKENFSKYKQFIFFKTVQDTKKYLLDQPIKPKTKVLLKGSRGIGLEKLLA